MRVLTRLLIALVGAGAGAVIGGGLTYALLSGEEADALTWLAVGLFICVPAMLGGAVAAGLLFRRRYPGVLGDGAGVGYAFAAVLLLVVVGPPVAIELAARDTDSERNLLAGKLCSEPGVRYVDETTRGVRVCFTVTPDRSAWVEIGWRFGRGSGCSGGATYLDYGGRLAGPGQITEPGFTATIRGSLASGVLRDSDVCPGRSFTWSARRKA